MPDSTTTPNPYAPSADYLRRLSVTNSVWQALVREFGANIDREIIKRAVEEGERVWLEQRLPTLEEINDV